MSQLTEQIASHYVAGHATELATLYAPEALVDLNVPQWRYQITGAEIESLLRRDFETEDFELTGHRITHFDNGVIVETEVRFTEEGEKRIARAINVFRTDGQRIVEHTNYCTGVWDAATIARQAIEAPMVRR